MKKFLLFLASLALVLACVPFAIADNDVTISELDAMWAEVSRTVFEGDFEGLAAVYHEDAVLVNGASHFSYPIIDALERWKPGIESTKNGEMRAKVSFRFSQRLNDATTAHETGMFYYSSTPTGEETSANIVNFEALLVKKNGEWKVVMEYQKSSGTVEDWNALDN